MAVNEDGVMATAGDNGSLWFWDWESGCNFLLAWTVVQPGSLDSEAGVYALSYDATGLRLVTCEQDCQDVEIKMRRLLQNPIPSVSSHLKMSGVSDAIQHQTQLVQAHTQAQIYPALSTSLPGLVEYLIGS